MNEQGPHQLDQFRQHWFPRRVHLGLFRQEYDEPITRGRVIKKNGGNNNGFLYLVKVKNKV